MSHRLSLERNAHRIVVLHEGRVVEQGTHAHLLARDARYASGINFNPAPPPTVTLRSARVG